MHEMTRRQVIVGLAVLMAGCGHRTASTPQPKPADLATVTLLISGMT